MDVVVTVVEVVVVLGAVVVDVDEGPGSVASPQAETSKATTTKVDRINGRRLIS
jgi:hypothetical protein